MRKRNYTVTIRMNKAEYDLLQSKVKESGQTQQAVVLHAIADLKIESAEEVEELKKLNQMLAETLSQLRGSRDFVHRMILIMASPMLRSSAKRALLSQSVQHSS